MSRRGSAAPSFLSRTARRIILAAASRVRVGLLLVTLPDGSQRTFGEPGSATVAEVSVHDERAFWAMLTGGEVGAGEAYMEGWWSSPDLAAALRLAALNRGDLALTSGWVRTPLVIWNTVAHRLRRNTREGSRRNIAAHYDLGNEFYQLFLDETMTYSSAVFESADDTLAEAQRTKYRRIADGAGLTKGMHVLEIGSGWGGFAMYAAGEIGCRVTSITVSREQRDLAVARVREAGLEHLVEVELRDYRDVGGTYDAIVSIEMLEAVGAEYFSTFFETCDRVLAPGGRLSLQVITVPDGGYERQRRGANWIQKYIFPGGLLPSLAVIERAAARTRLIITGVDDIAGHYVRTLALWRERFLDREDAVRAVGFDSRFIRMWEYYLALSEAGFATGITQDLQVVIE
ncbi:MAG: cyclopropane-fatty-acyl-phospholipid synthase family protein, partial [Candidatus Limnocylindria bacterium]